MEAKQKAKELVDHYFNVVYPYVGSDYMTGTENPSYKFKSAQREALFFAAGMTNLGVIPFGPEDGKVSEFGMRRIEKWCKVSAEIELMDEEEYLKSK